MRILIYGAGVIGSLYAVLFKEAGYDTTIYARGHRLDILQNQGLLYKKNNLIKKIDVRVLDQLHDNDIYDFIFLTVRENQLYQALTELKSNKSKTIVTMVNSLDNYEKWKSIVGKGRILPAFPGAGGTITNDILDAALTPRLIQPTTFSEISGKKIKRTALTNIETCAYTFPTGERYAYMAVMSPWNGCNSCRCLLSNRKSQICRTG